MGLGAILCESKVCGKLVSRLSAVDGGPHPGRERQKLEATNQHSHRFVYSTDTV